MQVLPMGLREYLELFYQILKEDGNSSEDIKCLVDRINEQVYVSVRTDDESQDQQLDHADNNPHE